MLTGYAHNVHFFLHCRMLGFEDALCAAPGGRFGRANSSSPIWMTSVYCNGYESALDLCYFTGGWGVHNYYYDCSHSNDAGVVCLDGQYLIIVEPHVQ